MLSVPQPRRQRRNDRRRGRFDIPTAILAVVVILLIGYSVRGFDIEVEKSYRNQKKEGRDELLSRVREHISQKESAKAKGEELAAEQRRRRQQSGDELVEDLQLLVINAAEISSVPQTGWSDTSIYSKQLPPMETSIYSIFSHQHYDVVRYYLRNHPNITTQQQQIYELDDIFSSLTTVENFIEILPKYSGIPENINNRFYRPSAATCYEGLMNVSVADWFDSWCDYVFVNQHSSIPVILSIDNDVRDDGYIGIPILLGAVYDALLTHSTSAESEMKRLQSCSALKYTGADKLFDALMQLPGKSSHNYDLIVVQNPPPDLVKRFNNYKTLHQSLLTSVLNISRYEVLSRDGHSMAPALLVNRETVLCTLPDDQPESEQAVTVIGSSTQIDRGVDLSFKILIYSDMLKPCESILYKSLSGTPHRRVVLVYQSSVWYYKSDFVSKKLQWMAAAYNSKASPLPGLGHGAIRHILQTSSILSSQDILRTDWVGKMLTLKTEKPVASPKLLNIAKSKLIPHLDVEVDEVVEEEPKFKKKHRPHECISALSLSTQYLRICGAHDGRTNGKTLGITIEKKTSVASEPWLFIGVIDGFQIGDFTNLKKYPFTSIKIGDDDSIIALSEDTKLNCQFTAIVKYSGVATEGLEAFNITVQGLFHNTILLSNENIFKSDLPQPVAGNSPLTELELSITFDPDAGGSNPRAYDFRWDSPTPYEDSMKSPVLSVSSRGLGMSLVSDINLIKKQHRSQTWSIPNSLYLRSGAAARNSSSRIVSSLDSLPAILNAGMRCRPGNQNKRLLYSPPPHTGNPLFRLFLFVGTDRGGELAAYTSSFVWLRFAKQHQQLTTPLPQVIPYTELHNIVFSIPENKNDEIEYGIALLYCGQSVETMKYSIEGVRLLKYSLWLSDDTTEHEEQHPNRISVKPTVCELLSHSSSSKILRHIYYLYKLEINSEILNSIDSDLFKRLKLSEKQFECILSSLQKDEYSFNPYGAALVTLFALNEKSDQRIVEICISFGHTSIKKYLYSGVRKPNLINHQSGSSSVETEDLTAVAAQLILLYKLTQSTEWLDPLKFAISQLSLIQQCWSPPRILCCRGNFFGGFTTNSQDPSWSIDSSVPVITLADYYLFTGNVEYLERAIAAARAAWTFMEHPIMRSSNQTFANKVLPGFYPVNMLRSGWEDPWYTSAFDLQGNRAAIASAYILRQFGNVWVWICLFYVKSVNTLHKTKKKKNQKTDRSRIT